MKRIITAILCLLLWIPATASAFEITGIKPDDSFLTGLGQDIAADKAYLKDISDQYRSRYVVTEESYADISDIDNFFKELSAPLTLAELDAGKTDFRSDIIRNENLKKLYIAFKVLGGHGGYSAEFEPVAYYSIHRSITLVGGYVQYHKSHSDPLDSYWQYVCAVEGLTKEIISYGTRMNLIERFNNFDNFIDNDKSFKIFVLKDGKIDSLYERGYEQ